MTFFLTSTLTNGHENQLNVANGFAIELKSSISFPCSALFICSNPHSFSLTDTYSKKAYDCLTSAGLKFEAFDVLDNRTELNVKSLLKKSNFIILTGGHVPTQNRFLNKLKLRKLLHHFDGVILGISAGAMNCADEVYAHPELDGEASSLSYERFLTGLGITKINVLPHYQMLANETLDGFHVIKEIACPDSIGRSFYGLPDGSYVLGKNDTLQIKGEAYLIHDGNITLVCRDGNSLYL